MVYRTLVIGVIFLFIGMSVQSSIGFSNNDDTTPPVTTCTLAPPEPDGNNGWYVSDVTVTLNATDDMSGVKEIRYTINNGAIHVITGNYGYFILDDDGKDILVEYWAIDNAGNVEPKKKRYIDIDQTEPEVEVCWEMIGGRPVDGWKMIGRANAIDDISGMERVEFYWDFKLRDTDIGPGPYYECEFIFTCNFSLKGFILNPKFTDEYVKFRALIIILTNLPEIVQNSGVAFDNAGNMDYDMIFEYFSSPEVYIDGIVLFRRITLPNNYTGHIGRFYIDASFNLY